ncbi:MAG TPA: anti-sigma factor [Gemmatimonadaceae bacterium]
MTSCAETRELLSAYVDGELAPERGAEVAEHLASCAECAREYEATLETVRTVKEGLVRYRAPDVLRARVRAAIREERPFAAPPARREGWRRMMVPWRAAAAAVVIAVASSGLTLLAAGGRAPGGEERALSDEVLASHVRSLMPEHLTDVRSSDQHNVKPWFNGRLDYSPTVPRLEEAGFPLLGGRLDYVHGRPVAVVVYGRRQHVINVFSWPAGADGDPRGVRETKPTLETRQGYNLLHWRSGGAEHWAASDLNAPELEQFVGLLGRAEYRAP